jgi:hypothetical protein
MTKKGAMDLHKLRRKCALDHTNLYIPAADLTSIPQTKVTQMKDFKLQLQHVDSRFNAFIELLSLP